MNVTFWLSRGGLYVGWVLLSWDWASKVAVGGTFMIFGAIFFARWLEER